MVDKLHTNPSLISALEKAAQHKSTASEVNEQRVSFIMGTVKDKKGLTKSRIQEVLSEQGGLPKR